MALLKSELLSLGINFVGFKHGWVQYEIYFRWESEPIINDNLLKKDGEYWGSRKTGSFLANEDEKDRLIDTISKTLQTNEAEYWEPVEPDVIVAIYPERHFPFLKSHYTLINESEDHKKKRKERERLKKKLGSLPDDSFTIIVFIDAYNFKNSDAYYGEGISLHLIVDRVTLEKFNSELSKEYSKFKERYKVNEHRE